MDETPVDIPTSWWERLRADKRRLAAVAVAVVAALVLLGVFVVRPLLDPAARGGRDIADIEIPPIDNGSQAETRTPGSDPATGAAGPGDDTTNGTVPGGGGSGSGDPGSGDDPSGPEEVPRRAPYIAYRLHGVIWVAGESGSDPVEVALSADGSYALSPDARTLALVEGGELALVTVADGRKRSVGPAEPNGLAWRSDSAILYFSRAASEDGGSPEVWRVAAGGGSTAKVLEAGSPAVAPDGTLVAPSAPGTWTDSSAGSSLWVLRPGGTPSEVRVQGRATECDAAGGLIAYAVHGTDRAGGVDAEPGVVPEIWTMRYSGGAQRRIVGPPATSRPFGYASLCFSPDGAHLLYAEVGDDGYSRAYVLPVEGGNPLALTVRRDTYPVGWSADGRSVFFVEGNAFQGEPTALMRCGLDGMGRRVVIEGAGL